MRYIFMRFPGGVGKAVTFSYDDASKKDMRLSDLLTEYGLKGTFNLNGEELRRGWNYCMSTEETKKYILDRGHEIALHGLEHRALGTLRTIEGIKEIYECRAELEERYNTIIRGLAYADSGVLGFENGACYEDVKRYLKDLDIVYARSLERGYNDFSMPNDWYAWQPTVHHYCDNIFKYINEFVNIDMSPKGHVESGVTPKLFFVWGHSSEFGDDEKGWAHMEEICKQLSGKEDIWYATNIEIYNYTKAYESLVWSAKGTRVYNPTLYEIWFDVDGRLYSIKSGKTLQI